MSVFASSPAKVILFGEHGVNRRQPAIAAAVGLRLFCHVSLRRDGLYRLKLKELEQLYSNEELRSFRKEVNLLRASEAYELIMEKSHDFFAPARYVLSHILDRVQPQGLDIEWRSQIPIGSGLGSGAAALTSMALAVMECCGLRPSQGELASLAWQGDVIAHGGVASSLDSSTCTFGGLIRYTVAEGVKPLPLTNPLPIVIGDTLVQKKTSAINTHVRTWLESHPARMHLFRDMGYLTVEAEAALKRGDMRTLGRLMNLHQLIQEKLGTSCPEIDRLVEASMGAGALGAKISGSGGGGIIIALAEPGRLAEVARAIDRAGGHGIITEAGAMGTRIESPETWERYLKPEIHM